MRHFEQELEQLKGKLLEMSALVESAIYRSVQGVVEKNQELAERYQIEGFPTLVILNGEGKAVWRFEGYYAGGVAAFQDFLEIAHLMFRHGWLQNWQFGHLKPEQPGRLTRLKRSCKNYLAR